MYWNSVKDTIKQNFGSGYGVSIIPMFRVKVWNGDELKNKHIKISSRAITGEIINDFIRSNYITNYFYGGYKINSFNNLLRCFPLYARNISTKPKS